MHGTLKHDKLINISSKDKTYHSKFDTTAYRMLFILTPLALNLCKAGLLIDVIHIILEGLVSEHRTQNVLALQVSIDDGGVVLDYPISSSVMLVEKFSIDNFLRQVIFYYIMSYIRKEHTLF